MENDVAKKENQYHQLTEIYKQLPKEKRSTYTTRNLEMLKNVKKYSNEITKILNDTKTIQKEINSLSETLGRSFSVVDDMIFVDAKKDTLAGEAYRVVVGINTQFKDIAETLSGTGSATNYALNLEDKIEKLTERTNALDYQTLNNDLQQVREENNTMKEQILELKNKKSDRKKD